MRVRPCRLLALTVFSGDEVVLWAFLIRFGR